MKVVVLAGVMLAMALATPAQAQPVVQLDHQNAKLGDTLVVRLSGWPAGTVSGELCGNQARRGSLDCDVAAASTIAVSAAGTAELAVPVTQPPVACPCVVRVRQVGGGAAYSAPVTISGAKGTRPPAAPATKLEVTRAGLGGLGLSWELVGGSARRTLSVTLHNPGPGPVAEPQVAVTVGRPGRATSGAVVYGTASLAAGEQRTMRIPVTFDAPAWGHYTARVEVRGADQPSISYAHAHAYPWLLLLIPLGAGALIIRRRRSGEQRAH